MSDDDLVRRGDAVRIAIEERERDFPDIRTVRDRLRALPAVPSASSPPAERLVRAADAVLSNVRAYGFADESWWTELTEALAAFRAAPEPAPKEEPAKPEPCRTCPHGLGIERVEGDHLGASVWMERCPECGGGA